MTPRRVLSDGWRSVRFGDVVSEVKVTTKDPEADGLTRVVGLEHLDPKSLPLRRWNELADLGDGTSFTRVFRSGQVLFGKRRAYQRKVAVPEFDGICSGDILVLEPASNDLLPEFLPYLVQSDGFFDHALGTSAGSLSPRTKFKELAKYEFALPPIPEQHRIVEVLSALDLVGKSYQSIDSHAHTLREAVFSDALSGPNMVDTAWGQLASGITVRPLGELAKVARGASPRPKGNPLYFATERTPHHWIMISDLARSRDGKVLTDTAEFLTDEGVLKSRQVGPGSLLLTNCATVGVPVFSGVSGCIHDGFLVFEDLHLISSDFLFRFFEFLTPWFRGIAQTGTQANLNTAILRAVEVPVLSGVEQALLVERLDAIDDIDGAAFKAHRVLHQGRTALLNRMLTGGAP